MIQGATNTKQQRVNQLKQSFSAIKQAYPTVEMIVDDEQNAKALIYVKSLKQIDQLALEKLLNMQVELSEIPTGIQPTKTRGGSWLVNNSGSNHCMTGFTAKRNSTGELGVITAGHCINSSTPLNYKDKDGTQYAISPVTGMYRNDTAMDLAFMKAGSTTAQQAVPEFYADTTSPARALTGKRNRTSTVVKSGTVKGSYVCHLGQTSPTNSALIQSCGEVISITGANHNGGNTYIVVSNTQSGAGTNHTSGLGTLRCVRGDSGGPWFALNTAFGIQSSCSWKDSGETITNTVVYTSVDYLNDLGAQLVYQ
ncbi:S1 family peptidase [Acinetobacter gyllenbergii]|uniref:S1 family peptidase n=1 Tax=Acinetobacter gyllenbergii TaxID=134534 RepID=UPI000A85D76C|nr:S1 family peptidase [Acinetobacter gyllenbergii]